MENYSHVIIPVLIEVHLFQRGHFNNDNIVCYMHGYEYNIFTGKLEHMRSWKKEDTWIEKSRMEKVRRLAFV
jgi:nitrite reductase/ring-hydroxylating ferredoxin subunit